jgi:hypothetical protein
MAAAGVPLRTLQYWMGHADSKTNQIYAHYQPAENKAEIVHSHHRLDTALDSAFGASTDRALGLQSLRRLLCRSTAPS